MSSWIHSGAEVQLDVRVREAPAGQPSEDLLSTLAKLLPVRFFREGQPSVEVAAELRVQVAEARELGSSASNPTSLCVPQSSSEGVGGQQHSVTVSFSSDEEVPFPFRSRTVTTTVAGDEPFLSPSKHERVLASSGRGPIWAMSEIGGIKHFRAALPLPRMSADESFSDVFCGERFLEMLPLLHLLRGVVRQPYENPPLRAAFIIDDPNLHWPRYGFVDYRQLVEHAQKENYHVAFATIPMDTWFTHAATADLFRRSSGSLSLLIHGNNHGKDELARPYPDGIRRGLLHQAIRRIERLETKAGLRVCRVMVPPHGACSSKMMADLPRCGFEAACISAGSLRAHNREQKWTRTLGYAPSENVEGCPVLPRWGITGNVENTLLVAAYLGQPMILRGHHDDLKRGLGVLERFARFINGLGDVIWSNLTDLSRLNYLWRSDGAVYQLKPLGTKVVFKLPAGTMGLTIDAPCAAENHVWELRLPDGSVRSTVRGETIPVADTDGNAILVETARIQQPDRSVETVLPPNPKLVLRRLLTEARDRFAGS